MIRSRTWYKRTRRWAVLGLQVGVATAIGTGCRLVNPPEPEPTLYPLKTAQYPGLLPTKISSGEPRPAAVASLPTSKSRWAVSSAVPVSAETTAGPIRTIGARVPRPSADLPEPMRERPVPVVHLERADAEEPAPSVSPQPGDKPPGYIQQVEALNRPPAGAAEAPAFAPAADTIDLGVALRLAGIDNPTINLARARIREALALQLGARSLLLPTFNVGGNYHYHSGNLQASYGAMRNLTSQVWYFGAGARTVAAETIAFPGVRLFAHLGDAVYEPIAARQEVNVRQSDAQAIQNATLGEVATEYLQLIGAEARLTVLRQGETDLAEVVRLTRVYAEKGQGRAGDANRALANADLLRQEIRRAEEEVAVASARLCRLLNLDPSTGLRTPGGAVEPFRLIAEDEDTETLVEGAVRNRPEIFARSSEVSEAQTRVRQEKVRPLLPTISAGFSAGGLGGGGSLVNYNSSPLRGRTDFDVLAVWNVQNFGFGNLARVRTANAIVGESLGRYDAAVNLVRRQVLETQAEARAAARQLELARTAVTTAEEGYRLETDRIQQGQGLPIEVLDSFRQLVESRQELVRAIIGFNVAQFRLFVAIGNNPIASESGNAVGDK